MGLKFKINVLDALKEAGFTSYRIRKEKLLSESTLQKLRNGEGVSWENLSVLCDLLKCQPGDILVFEESENPDEWAHG